MTTPPIHMVARIRGTFCGQTYSRGIVHVTNDVREVTCVKCRRRLGV